MKYGMMALASFALASGAESREWSLGSVFIDRETGKPLTAISGCISKAWERRSGTTTYVPTEDGFTMRLSYDTLGGTIVATQVDATDRKNARQVVVYARKGDRNQKLRREIEGCL